MSKEGLFFYFCVISKKKKSKKIEKKGEISKAGLGSGQVGVGVGTGQLLSPNGLGSGLGSGSRQGSAGPRPHERSGTLIFLRRHFETLFLSPSSQWRSCIAHLLSTLLAPSIVAAQQLLAL